MSDTTKPYIYYGINEQILSTNTNTENYNKITNNNIFSINSNEQLKNTETYSEKIIANFFKKFTE